MFSDLLSRLRSDTERSPGIVQIERGLLLFFLILLIGTVGYELIGDFEYVQALYMTIITIFSVGYGDTGVDTTGEKIFTMALILSGTTIGLYIAGGFVRIVAEGEINKVVGKLMKTRNIEGLSGHTIICGYGRMSDLSNDISALGLEIDELSLNAQDEFVGGSIREFEQGSQANFIVLAIRRADETILQHPPHDALLQEGDSLIILSSPENITPLLSRHARKRELA